jgi:hypothetical protein
VLGQLSSQPCVQPGKRLDEQAHGRYPGVVQDLASHTTSLPSTA